MVKANTWLYKKWIIVLSNYRRKHNSDCMATDKYEALSCQSSCNSGSYDTNVMRRGIGERTSLHTCKPTHQTAIGLAGRVWGAGYLNVVRREEKLERSCSRTASWVFSPRLHTCDVHAIAIDPSSVVVVFLHELIATVLQLKLG